jgi:hypothetical protein
MRIEPDAGLLGLCGISDFPQAQTVRWGDLRSIGAASAANERHHVRGWSPAEPNVDERSDQRANHLVAERVGPHLEGDEVV